jgi:hypothetical protein
MRFLIGSAALCALLVAAPVFTSPAFAADAKPKAERSCFRAQEINGFNVVDKQTVDVSISPKTVYRLTLFAPSPDINWTQRIGVESRGSSWICSGMDATIIVPGDIGIGRYPVTDVRKLTPDEILASRKKKKP